MARHGLFATSFTAAAMQHVWPDYALGDVLKMFKQGKSHMGLVKDVNDSGEVITLGFCGAPWDTGHTIMSRTRHILCSNNG